MRPFLKWAGNKYRCLDHILASFPTAKRLIEPFAGSGVIFINSDYSDYLLAEENKDLIALFNQIQREGETFIIFCEQYFSPTNNTEAQYYHFRDQFNQSKDTRLRAAIFLYLNRHGYNGLCRYNQKGIYNVPFGRYTRPYFPHKEMLFFHQKSQKATFIHSDFRATFAKAKLGDVIYCDPPYAPRIQVSNFSSYTEKKFGLDEQIILAELATESALRGIPVLISNHDTEFTRHHYRHATLKSFPVRRSISCQERIEVDELLAIFNN